MRVSVFSSRRSHAIRRCGRWRFGGAIGRWPAGPVATGGAVPCSFDAENAWPIPESATTSG